MLCTECGCMNQPQSRICQNCHSVLPDRSKAPPYRSGHFDMLDDAVRKVKSLQISSGEFREILSRLQNMFAKALDDVQSMDISEDIAMEMGEEIKTGSDGIKLFIEALKELARYTERREMVCLDRGMLMAKDANNRVNRAMQLNWENFRNLQDTTEEFIRSQSMI